MLAELRAGVWALSAIRIATESGLLTQMDGGERDVEALARATRLDVKVTARLLEVLEAYDIAFRDGDVYALTKEGAELARRGSVLSSELTSTFAQAQRYRDAALASDLSGGWALADAEMIHAQGVVSGHATQGAMDLLLHAVPAFERLARPGARMLEVGVGSARSAIGMCRRFPGLRVTGLEPLRAAYLVAESNIAFAGMKERIELRAQRGEDLGDEAVYDAAFVPGAFISDAVLPGVLARVRRALLPGGLLMVAAWNASPDPRLSAASRLRWQLWGAGPRTAHETIRVASDAGFRDLREGPANGDLAPIFGVA